MQRINTGFLTLLATFGFLLSATGLKAQASQGDPAGAIPFTVVLDAGHGGHDPGNLGNGFLEKNIALSIVLEAGKALEQEGNVKVIYTRDDDTFIDLYKRGEIANKAQADLFVSVHCDSHSSNANGAGTFVLGLHANKQNFEVAKKENSVIYLEDNYESRYADYDISSPESVIGLTIMQEEFLDQSILLGKLMQDRFTGKLNRKDRKVKQAGFIVLHQTFMPSVLIETGFLTNRDEGQYLNSKKGQQEMGRAIAEAILEYRSTIPSNNSVIAPNVGENIPEETPLKSQEVIKEAGDVKKGAEAEIAAQNAAGVANNDKTREAVVDPQPPKEKAVNPENRVQEKLEETGAEAEVKSSADLNKSGDLKAVAKAETPDSGLPGPAVKTGGAIVVGTQVAKEDSAETPAKNVGRSEAANKTPAAETRNKTNPSVTEKAGVTFKVQLMAVSNDIPLTPSNFKGLNTLSKEPINSMYRILYGNTSSYEQAKVLQAGARQKGYDQAYIVAYKDGQRIAVDKALTYLSN
jgi:N-acetylmuramoyl-L-alanine amidase